MPVSCEVGAQGRTCGFRMHLLWLWEMSSAFTLVLNGEQSSIWLTEFVRANILSSMLRIIAPGYIKKILAYTQSSAACFSVIFPSRNRYNLIKLSSLTEESRSVILRIDKFNFPLCPAPHKPLSRGCCHAILTHLIWFLAIAELVLSFILWVCIYEALLRTLMFSRGERGIKAL